MIIDIHTHTFPPKIASDALRSLQSRCHTALFADGTAEGLRQSMLQSGIDLSAVQPVATSPRQVPHINDAVIRTNRDTGETGIFSFGCMHPACECWESELERLAKENVRGIKLHPPYEEVDIDDPRTIAILRRCREFGLIVLIHSGWDVGIPGADQSLPRKIRNALDAAGSVKLIAAHMGGWKCWEDSARYLSDTEAYLDTSFSLGQMIPAQDHYPWTGETLSRLDSVSFCDLVHTFGPERILFGTDSPWADAKEEIRQIRQLPLQEEEIALILGENAEKLLGLSPA